MGFCCGSLFSIPELESLMIDPVKSSKDKRLLVRILKDAHMPQYCVLYVLDGKTIKEYTYFTKSKQDALRTMKQMIDQYDETPIN